MIGVIGCGNMSQAIVKGYYSKNNEVRFMTYTPSYTRAHQLAEDVGGVAVKNLSDMNEASSILLACKPQQFTELAKDLRASEVDLKNKHFISILAATPIETIQSALGVSRVTRVMPNTPALIGSGISLILHSGEVLENERSMVDDFFTSCGEVVDMPNEEIFDQVTTVSGSGPAYVFLFAKTMSDKLQEWGLDSQKARDIAIQLFKGSSELMHSQKELSFDEQINKVTSKGGVTIEAVKSYRSDDLGKITSRALDAAYKRSMEMTELFRSE